MVGPLGTLPGVTLGSVSGSIFWRPFQGTPGQNSENENVKNETSDIILVLKLLTTWEPGISLDGYNMVK